MATKTKAIAWDSAVVIDCIQKTAHRWALIEPMVKEAKDGKLLIAVSEIAIAEVCHLEKNAMGLSIDEQVALIEQFFNEDYVEARIVDRRTSKKAAELKRDHGIKTCDAVIAATALLSNVDALYTFDGSGPNPRKNKLLPLDGRLSTSDGRKLPILQPAGSAYGQLQLTPQQP
jgi:predicted nucleic acid-binding protein